MKKIICCILIVLLFTAAVSVSAFADSVDMLGDPSANVKAKYQGITPDDVYSVDITWGAMEFDFTSAGEKWDAEAHKWVADETKPAVWSAKDNSNIVTLKNHSSQPMNAHFVFSANEDYTNLSGSFLYDNSILTSALELELPHADTEAKPYIVAFNPSGTIPATHSSTTYSKMGTISISLL